ncbi:MAG: PmoA family protein, partial [Planctomycetales bacterium]
QPSLLADKKTEAELCFVLPELKAGKSLKLTATFSDQPADAAKSFAWTDTEGKFAVLGFGNQPALKYMYEAIDPSRREETYKVFHHVYDPSGERVLTKGPGGKYTHHRGVFFGFSKISYDEGKKRVDTWHCKGDAHLSHEGFLASEAGPVLGRHRAAVDWHGIGKEVFAKEQRELTVYKAPGGWLIEFASRLVPVAGPVRLDGDPQHAGFQFRADNEVAAKTAKQTYYLRPDGKGKLGETRNWPGQKDHADLPWNAMSFVLGEQRYTCCYLDRPSNPKEARFSERDYGRFGSYFQYDLTEKKPLEVNYRLWIQRGEMDGEQVGALRDNFVAPVGVQVTGG